MTDSDPSDPFTVLGVELTICESCGEPMVGTRQLCLNCAGAVPIEALEEVVEGFKESCEKDADKGFSNAAGTWAMAAHELQEVIENYE